MTIPTNTLAVHAPNRSSATRPIKQQGFTLIELLVALAVSTVVTLAAFSALIISRQGLTAVDSAAQLRDNARFSTDLMQRLGVQTGYLSDRSISTPKQVVPDNDLTAPEDVCSSILAPNVCGFNNALVRAASPTGIPNTRGSNFLDGSDVLILRFQPNETASGSGVSDGSMINCAGTPIVTPAIDSQDRVWNVLHVALGNDGEPSLFCSVGPNNPQPIIRGVETFQVLYGVDNVTAGVAVAANAPIANSANSYLRADQMLVPGNLEGTQRNWERVRSIRIGMVLRGPVGSSPVVSNANTTYFPLGTGVSAVGGDRGSALSTPADVGTIFRPGADTRLRQVITFTIHLRNDQNV